MPGYKSKFILMPRYTRVNKLTVGYNFLRVLGFFLANYLTSTVLTTAMRCKAGLSSRHLSVPSSLTILLVRARVRKFSISQKVRPNNIH
jgi:hypothetical protein